MVNKKVKIPNVPYCLKVIRNLIQAVPESKETRVNYKALAAKKKLAAKAVAYLEKIMGKGANVAEIQPCLPMNQVIP